MLQRGEKLDNLVERSEALSAQSKMFYKTAKKVNVVLHLFHQTCSHLHIYYIAKLVLSDNVVFVVSFNGISCDLGLVQSRPSAPPDARHKSIPGGFFIVLPPMQAEMIPRIPTQVGFSAAKFGVRSVPMKEADAKIPMQ